MAMLEYIEKKIAVKIKTLALAVKEKGRTLSRGREKTLVCALEKIP